MTQPLTSHQPPFLVEHRRLQETPAGFTPEARLALTSALKSSGLLAILSDEQVRTLLAVLSLLTPNGVVQATAWEVANLLKVSERQARKQLENLSRARWQDEPVVHQVSRETGVPVFALSPALLAQEEAPVLPEAVPSLPPVAGREAVIAHSRAAYARTREEVEREIAHLNGWDVPEAFATPDEKALAAIRQRLLVIGLSAEQTDDLLSRFDLARIQRQLNWLSYRKAKHPIGFLIAAIEGDYDAPASLRQTALDASPEQAQNDTAPQEAQAEMLNAPTALPEEAPAPEVAREPAVPDAYKEPEVTVPEPEQSAEETTFLNENQVVSLPEEQPEESA